MDGHIFISYAIKDKDVAEEVCEYLESSSWKCWIAPRDVLPSSDWGEAIIDAISQSRLMVLVFSGNANGSMQVKREVERATSKGIPVVPIRIEDVPESKFLEYHLSTAYWVDAVSSPLEPHLRYLAEMVSKAVGVSGQGLEPTQPNLCAGCGAAVEPGAVRCGACGHERRAPSAAQEMPLSAGRPRMLRRRWRFLLRSRAAKVSAAAVCAVAIALGIYISTRRDSVETYVSRAEAYMRDGEYDLGIEEFSKGVSKYPASPLGYRARGSAYFHRGLTRNVPDDFRRAESDFTTAIKLDPRDSFAHSMLGQTYLRMADFRRAVDAFNAALKIDNLNADSWKGLARTCFMLKDHDCSVKCYTAVLNLYPRDPDALIGRGYAYVEKADYGAAMRDFQSARDINTSNPYPYRGMSEVSRKLGRADEALKFDQEAIRLSSSQAQPMPAR